jgi:hypothetical protein
MLLFLLLVPVLPVALSRLVVAARAIPIAPAPLHPAGVFAPGLVLFRRLRLFLLSRDVLVPVRFIRLLLGWRGRRRKLDGLTLGAPQRPPAAVIPHARIDHEPSVATALARVLPHLEAAEDPFAVRKVLVVLQAADEVVLLIPEIPRHQEAAVPEAEPFQGGPSASRLCRGVRTRVGSIEGGSAHGISLSESGDAPGEGAAVPVEPG